MKIDIQLINMLQCPVSGKQLKIIGDALVTETGFKYNMDFGIPLFAEHPSSDDAHSQQKHYDKVTRGYLENLSYSHTKEYMKYLDNMLIQHVNDSSLEAVAEICCGSGEALKLFQDRIKRGVGVDISISMLKTARANLPQDFFLFVQGDATMLPLASEQFTSVFMLGGVHHINDREKLFAEIFRILKPGGYFFWREPVNDFFLWTWLRAIIYKISPALDEKHEHPLSYETTSELFRRIGFELESWQTYGFIGYCFFMNSDILLVNKLFRFVPGIRFLAKFMAKFDEWILKLPGFAKLGLQVIGAAKKPRDGTKW